MKKLGNKVLMKSLRVNFLSSNDIAYAVSSLDFSVEMFAHFSTGTLIAKEKLETVHSERKSDCQRTIKAFILRPV